MPTTGWTAKCPKCGNNTFEMEERLGDKRGECLSCGFFMEDAWDCYQNRSVLRAGFIVKEPQRLNEWAVVNHWFDSPARIHFGWVNYTQNSLMKVPEKLMLSNPLHIAVKNGEYGKVKEILGNDSTFAYHFPDDIALSLDENFGFTLLHAAALSGNVRMADLVAEFSAMINGIDNDGVTALHLSAELGHVDMTRWLLSRNVKVNIQDKDGDTPLHFAAHQNSMSYAYGPSHGEIMEMLVSHGADPEIRNQKGQTCMDILLEAEVKFEKWNAELSEREEEGCH